MSFEVHPLAELIPNMGAAEYRELRDDIKANGLREPVTLYENKILDGRNRAKACDELGIEAAHRDYEGAEPVAFVVSVNVHRRHLTVAQRAEVARRALPKLREEAKARQVTGGRKGGEAQSGDSEAVGLQAHGSKKRARDEAGRLAGVSGRSVARLNSLAEQAPELHAQVMDGTKTIWRADKEMRNGNPGPSRAVAPVLESKRDHERAHAAKRRVESFVGTCQSMPRGLPDLRVEAAALVSTTEEVKGWDQCIGSAIAALRDFKKRIPKEA